MGLKNLRCAIQNPKRSSVWGVVFAFVARSAIGIAAIGGAAADAPSDSDRCAGKIDGKWSLAEKFVWTRICSGLTADFNHAEGFGGELAADKEQGWATANRDIGAEFLQKVLSEKKYLDEIPRKTISIDGAHLPRGSQVDISAADVNFLQILNCRFDSALAFSFANVANQIFVARSRIDELRFYALTAKNLSISDSRIERLDVVSSNISNSVALESIKSDSDIIFRGKAENVEIIGSSDISSLNFEQYRVDGNIAFFGGLGAISVKNLTLFRSKVGGTLYFSSEFRFSVRQFSSPIFDNI